jgi:hypothetical protein
MALQIKLIQLAEVGNFLVSRYKKKLSLYLIN